MPASYLKLKFHMQIFEDPGGVASGATSVVWDAERQKLFLHGTFSI